MNPTSTLRMRRATAVLALAWALLALVLGVRASLASAGLPELPFTFSGAGGRYVVHSLAPSAEAAGFRSGARLLAVDGVPAGQWLRSPQRRRVLGETHRYLVRLDDGRRVEAELAPLAPGSGAFFVEKSLRVAIPLLGAIYLAIAVVVWRLRSERRASWAFLLFCCAMAVELFLSGETGGRVASFVNVANVPLVGATACHLFSTYPFEPAWVVRAPQLRTVPYALAGALVAFILVEWRLGVDGVSEDLAFFYTVGLALFCIASLGVQRWQRHGDPMVARSTVILLGAGASFLPAIATLLVQYFRGTPFPWTVSLMGLVLFPLAVGYGIVREQLFDIRMVARSSVAYGAVTLAITGLFASLITFADALFTRINVNARSPLFSVAFLFFAILLFNPLRSRVQRVVDAFFDRDRAAYRRAVREISEAMVSMLAVDEIVERILVAATDTMGVERALVLLVDEAREGPRQLRVAASRGDWDEVGETGASLALWIGHPLVRRLHRRREELTRADFDHERDAQLREDCRDVFDTLEAEILVPIVYAGDLLGVVAVGRKLSGDRLGADDRQLLRTLANQSAIAIENARAFDEIAQLNETLEARVEDRTRELRGTQAQLLQSEKMRSLGQLVAGVAHELNNPIGFVHANLQLIDDYVDRLEQAGLDPAERAHAREAVHKLLARSREGTSRVKKIVQDLRSFSRTDEAELEEVDLNQEIDRTLTLMESRLGHGIAVERDYGELPPVRCFAGQLNQVFLNLLINACDALEGKGTIRIRTRPTADGVQLEFSDDGPGIPEHVRERIFEPFFTTKEVGRGTGLGLSLSHGIVERHGGRLSVRSEAGEGASFTLELPREARPPLAALPAG